MTLSEQMQNIEVSKCNLEDSAFPFSVISPSLVRQMRDGMFGALILCKEDEFAIFGFTVQTFRFSCHVW